MKVHLLADTPSNTHVNLPSGKISKSGIQKPKSKQKGMTCVLNSMRRIGFFNQKNKDEKAIKTYKRIKNALKKCYDANSSDYVELVKLGEDICKEWKISLNEIYNFKQFHNYYAERLKEFPNLDKEGCYYLLDLETKWIILYNLLIEKILMPLMNIKESTWQPQLGITALKKSLQENGAHFFLGKLGDNYHTEHEVIKEESTPSRTIYKVNDNNVRDSRQTLVHAIIVDQIKTIHGTEMVFFRDPMFSSIPGVPEKIFMIGYDNFVERLADNGGYRFAKNECNVNSIFGMVSECPENLYSGKRMTCSL